MQSNSDNRESFLDIRDEVKKKSRTVNPVVDSNAGKAALGAGVGAYTGGFGALYGAAIGSIFFPGVGTGIGAAVGGAVVGTTSGAGHVIANEQEKALKLNNAREMVDLIGQAVDSGEQSQVYEGLKANLDKRKISSADNEFYTKLTDVATNMAKDKPDSWEKEWKGLKKQLNEALDNPSYVKGFETAARQLQAHCLANDVEYTDNLLNFGKSEVQIKREERNAKQAEQGASEQGFFESMIGGRQAVLVGYSQVTSEQKKVAAKKSPPQQNGSYEPPAIPSLDEQRQPQQDRNFATREGNTTQEQGGYAAVEFKKPAEPRELC